MPIGQALSSQPVNEAVPKLASKTSSASHLSHFNTPSVISDDSTDDVYEPEDEIGSPKFVTTQAERHVKCERITSHKSILETVQQWEKENEILRRVKWTLKRGGRRMKNAARTLWRWRHDLYDENCFFWDID